MYKKCINNKKFSCLIIISIFICSLYIYKNIPIRTAIFRTFIQGNWYITSEQDTVYTLGYYGIKKFISDDNGNLSCIEENKEICKSSLIGFLIARSGTINENYIYIALRSYLTGNQKYNSKDYINGKLIILQKNDLSIVKEIKSDIKYTDSKIYRNKLILSGIRGFDIYDISKKDNPILILKKRGSFEEFQGLSIFEHEKKTYIAFSNFGNGISIWRLYENGHASFISHSAINETKYKDDKEANSKLQCFNIIVKYPYIYSTLAPKSSYFNTKYDRRGLIVYNISNLKEIRQSFVYIPKNDWYNNKIGDPAPSYIDIYKNKLYVNFGEKGIAEFDLSNPEIPQYKRTINISNKNNVIQPIHINHKGILFIGDYYWSEIYSLNLNNIKNGK